MVYHDLCVVTGSHPEDRRCMLLERRRFAGTIQGHITAHFGG